MALSLTTLNFWRTLSDFSRTPGWEPLLLKIIIYEWHHEGMRNFVMQVLNRVVSFVNESVTSLMNDQIRQLWQEKLLKNFFFVLQTISYISKRPLNAPK